MEAVLRVPADAPDQDDTVHQVFQKGYRFRNHLVRPARVSVRKHE
jgi:molecular chaperone GrpE (heat shock protein)